MFEQWKLKRYEKSLSKSEERGNAVKEQRALIESLKTSYDEAEKLKDEGDRYLALRAVEKEISDCIKDFGRFPAEKILVWPLLAGIDLINIFIAEEKEDETNFRSLRRRYSSENKDLGEDLLHLNDRVKFSLSLYVDYQFGIDKILQSSKYQEIAHKYPEMRKAFIKHAKKNGSVKPQSAPETKKLEL
jgi:hypothetical protein